MRIIEKSVPASKIVVGDVIYNPAFPGLNRCLEVNEIVSAGGFLIFTDTYLGESTSLSSRSTVTQLIEEF